MWSRWRNGDVGGGMELVEERRCGQRNGADGGIKMLSRQRKKTRLSRSFQGSVGIGNGFGNTEKNINHITRLGSGRGIPLLTSDPTLPQVLYIKFIPIPYINGYGKTRPIQVRFDWVFFGLVKIAIPI